MDAADQIVELFDRLVELEPDERAARPLEEQIIFLVVAARGEIDINGFASVYEQLLGPVDLALMAGGLDHIGERELAEEFCKAHALLESDGFYRHGDWAKVSTGTKLEIDRIGSRVGDRLWELDVKLLTLLESQDPGVKS